MHRTYYDMKAMQTLHRYLSYGSIILILGLLVSCVDRKQEKQKEYGPSTRALLQIVENDPEVKSMLVSSIEKAREINPDTTTNPAQNLEEYFDFVSYCETAMPWALVKKPNYPRLFDNIFQSLACFYFLLDQPLPELEGKGYINNSLQYAEPIASWLVTFTKSWGKYLDSRNSWNNGYYQMALNDPAFGLQEGWYEDPSHWKTFNQFFARHLRSPHVRPVAAPSDNSIVVSFADCTPQGAWAIDSNSNIVSDGGVPVKSATVMSIAQLIGEDSAYKDAFANGTFIHSFLHTSDYHRFHFPVSGTIREVRLIQGGNPAGGRLWWDADHHRYAFDPRSLGWQMIETRGCVILDTGDYGLVALLPVGMVAVGSVNFEDNIKAGTQVQKGDMLGYFAFGGSDFIMIFQDKCKFTLDAPREQDSDAYSHLFMGERLGHLKIR